MAMWRFLVLPYRAVGGRLLVIVMPGVGDPFVDIAVHVVQAIAVGRLGAGRLGLALGILEVPGVSTELGITVTERKSRGGAGAPGSGHVPGHVLSSLPCRLGTGRRSIGGNIAHWFCVMRGKLSAVLAVALG